MNLDSYILQGFEALKNKTVIIDGTSIDAVYDASTYMNKKRFAFEVDDTCIITIKTSDMVTDSRNYLKKLVTVDSSQWEIVATQKGSATTQFTLINPHAL